MAHPARQARRLARSRFKAAGRGRRHPRQSHPCHLPAPHHSLIYTHINMHQVRESVKRQVENVVNTKIIQHAWADKKDVRVHGWVYELETGRLRDLGVTRKASWAPE